MKLEKEEIIELRELLAEEYGKELPLNQVEIVARYLINLYGSVLNKNEL